MYVDFYDYQFSSISISTEKLQKADSNLLDLSEIRSLGFFCLEFDENIDTLLCTMAVAWSLLA